MSQRNLSSCVHKYSSTNCKKCGIYNHQEDAAIKTNRYDSFINCSAQKYLVHMRKRQTKAIDFKQISQPTYLLLQSICDKFEYTIQTLALGLYIYARTCHHQGKDEKFWASASLIVASKGIQLDKRVPYLNRYQRYADVTFSQQDYQLAQKSIFEQINFDVQYSTFISFLHFYLTNGVLFKSDCFHEGSVKYFEDDIMSKAKDYLKTGQFLNYEPEKLALSIIKQIRIKFRLGEWKKELQILSGFKSQQIPLVEKSNILKPLNIMYQKNKDKHNYNLSMSKSGLNYLQSSLNLTEQKIKTSKKKLEQTVKLQSLKQNIVKPQHQAPLTTLRSHVFSASKYPHNFSLSNTNQNIISLSSFASRRV